jgi:hypothetical protein
VMRAQVEDDGDPHWQIRREGGGDRPDGLEAARRGRDHHDVANLALCVDDHSPSGSLTHGVTSQVGEPTRATRRTVMPTGSAVRMLL